MQRTSVLFSCTLHCCHTSVHKVHVYACNMCVKSVVLVSVKFIGETERNRG